MKVVLKETMLILVPQGEAEQAALAAWKAGRGGHVLYLHTEGGTGLPLTDLGPREEACREPINVSSKATHPSTKLISNFAATPFRLDGRDYASVEGFWQALKFESAADRLRVAALVGREALRAGREQAYGATVTYEGRPVVVGTCEHWRLMEQACWAKFTQHEAAREALLATGERPLEHRMRRDSRTIPGVIMAGIWMKIRRQLRGQVETAAEDPSQVELSDRTNL